MSNIRFSEEAKKLSERLCFVIAWIDEKKVSATVRLNLKEALWNIEVAKMKIEEILGERK